MTVQEVFEVLHQLNAGDKFRAVQLLLKDLAVEEENSSNMAASTNSGHNMIQPMLRLVYYKSCVKKSKS